MHTATQPEITTGNSESVQAPSKQTPAKSARLSVNSRRYWEGRLYQESYSRGGEKFTVPEYYVKLNHAGKRRAFNTGTANKVAAADKALEIWQHLDRHGWQATLDRFAPSAAQIDTSPTLGAFLAEVERTAGLKPRTFHRYAMYLRGILAHAAGIKDNARRRYDYRTGGHAAWAAKVDATALSQLTPAAAADWKADYLARAGDDPVQQVRSARAFNAALRSAKSLFSSAVLTRDNFHVRVPRFKITNPQTGEREILWHENLTFEKCGDMRFSLPQGLSYESLLVAARRELRETHPDAYLLLLLCLCAGLRRAEADVLLWDQIHLGDKPDDCFIQIETNQFIQPKHGSGGKVFAEPELLRELLADKARSQSSFVVSSPMQWKRTIHFRYRCAPHWKVLNTWLAGKGITDRKKIHFLRKAFGDALCKSRGIYAAKAQLRHSSVQMTEKHYADPAQRAPLPVAGMLSDEPVKALPDHEAEDVIARLAGLSPDALGKVAAAIQKLRVAPSLRIVPKSLTAAG